MASFRQAHLFTCAEKPLDPWNGGVKTFCDVIGTTKEERKLLPKQAKSGS